MDPQQAGNNFQTFPYQNGHGSQQNFGNSPASRSMVGAGVGGDSGGGDGGDGACVSVNLRVHQIWARLLDNGSSWLGCHT